MIFLVRVQLPRDASSHFTEVAAVVTQLLSAPWREIRLMM